MSVFVHATRCVAGQREYTVWFLEIELWQPFTTLILPHSGITKLIFKQENTGAGPRDVLSSGSGGHSWGLPVSELTSLITMPQNRIREIQFGTCHEPLLLKGSQQDIARLAETLQRSFTGQCRDLRFHVRTTHPTLPLFVSPVPILKAFQKLFLLEISLGDCAGPMDEIVPLLIGGALVQCDILKISNPLTVEQCLSLVRPAGDRNNSVLFSLDLGLTVEPGVEAGHSGNMQTGDARDAQNEALKQSLATGAAQSGKKLAHLLFHFKYLNRLVIRETHVGSSFVGSPFLKSLLTELLDILQHHQDDPQNREGLAYSISLYIEFPDLLAQKVSDDCKCILMDFVDSWSRSPVRFYFKQTGLVRDPFDAALMFRSIAKWWVFEKKLQEPNNQHYKNLLAVTSLTDEDKQRFACCCSRTLVEPSLRLELLRLYPNMMKPCVQKD